MQLSHLSTSSRRLSQRAILSTAKLSSIHEHDRGKSAGIGGKKCSYIEMAYIRVQGYLYTLHVFRFGYVFVCGVCVWDTAKHTFSDNDDKSTFPTKANRCLVAKIPAKKFFPTGDQLRMRKRNEKMLTVFVCVSSFFVSIFCLYSAGAKESSPQKNRSAIVSKMLIWFLRRTWHSPWRTVSESEMFFFFASGV